MQRPPAGAVAALDVQGGERELVRLEVSCLSPRSGIACTNFSRFYRGAPRFLIRDRSGRLPIDAGTSPLRPFASSMANQRSSLNQRGKPAMSHTDTNLSNYLTAGSASPMTKAKAHGSLRIRKLVTVLVISAAALGMLGQAANASGNLHTVTEKEGYAWTGVYVRAGQSVNIDATNDQIWAGWWFTGWNGPMGWTSKCNSQCPMPNERAYSLLAQIGSQQVYVGAGRTFTAASSGYVVLKINDDVPGNGAGYFRAFVTPQ